MTQGCHIPLQIRVKCIRLYSIHKNYSTVQQLIHQNFNRKITINSIKSINQKFDKFGYVIDIKKKEKDNNSRKQR